MHLYAVYRRAWIFVHIAVLFKVYMQGKMKNLKFRNLERNDLP